MNNAIGNTSWIGGLCFSSIPGLKDDERAKAQLALLNAYITVQQKLEQPSKGTDGYGYKYADLNAVVSAIQEASTDIDIAYIQQPVLEGGKTGAHNYLINSKGAIIDFGSYVLDIGGATPQKAGAALTYARRYSISCIFGIASEDDDDAKEFNNKVDFMTPKELKGIKVVYNGKRKDLIEVYALAVKGDAVAKQVLESKDNSVRAKIAIKSIGSMYKLAQSLEGKDVKKKKENKKPVTKDEALASAGSQITQPKQSEKSNPVQKPKNDDPFAEIDKQLNS